MSRDVIWQPGHVAEESITATADGLGDGWETSGHGDRVTAFKLVPFDLQQLSLYFIWKASRALVSLLEVNVNMHQIVCVGLLVCSEVDVTLNQVRCSLRQDVIWLLLSVIDQPSPNLAHFLLGFDVRKPVARTTLQDPGKY